MAVQARKHGIREWEAVHRAASMGATVRDAAAAAGVSRMSAWRLSRIESPGEGMWPDLEPEDLVAGGGRTMGYEDRCLIEAYLAAGLRPAEIGRRIGRAPSTVRRELRRCPDGAYSAKAAQADAWRLARRPKPRKLEADPALRAAVVRGLSLRWSPRQISRRLAAEHPGEESMSVSHETIYRSIYIQARGSLRQEVAVEAALRRGGSGRKPKSRMPPRGRKKSWVENCGISLRPAEAADRAVPGHWEGDLVVSSNGSCLVTLVERKTRFLVARRLDGHSTKTVVDLLVEMAAAVPDAVAAGLLKTLTWDQGVEMADAARFTAATGMKVFFCDPHSPWQKGTNENTNGLIRQYFPKGTDFRRVADGEVAEMQDQLNGRPRETLGWRTPAEALESELVKANGATTA